MKNVVSILLSLIIVFAAVMPVAALERPNYTDKDYQTPRAMTAKEKQFVNDTIANIKQKYGVTVTYHSNVGRFAKDQVEEIEVACKQLGAAFFKELVGYYAAQGKTFTIDMRPVDEGYNRDPRTAGHFNHDTATASIYVQKADRVDDGYMVAVFQTHLVVLHEIGHGYYQMVAGKYGHERLKAQWTSLNNGYNYDSPHGGHEIHFSTYVTTYAKTSFEEDFCETLSMVYADRSHYLFQRYSFIDSNGVPNDVLPPTLLPPSTGSPLYKKSQIIHSLTKSYVGEDCVATRNAAKFLTLVQ